MSTAYAQYPSDHRPGLAKRHTAPPSPSHLHLTHLDSLESLPSNTHHNIHLTPSSFLPRVLRKASHPSLSTTSSTSSPSSYLMPFSKSKSNSTTTPRSRGLTLLPNWKGGGGESESFLPFDLPSGSRSNSQSNIKAPSSVTGSRPGSPTSSVFSFDRLRSRKHSIATPPITPRSSSFRHELSREISQMPSIQGVMDATATENGRSDVDFSDSGRGDLSQMSLSRKSTKKGRRDTLNLPMMPPPPTLLTPLTPPLPQIQPHRHASLSPTSAGTASATGSSSSRSRVKPSTLRGELVRRNQDEVSANHDHHDTHNNNNNNHKNNDALNQPNNKNTKISDRQINGIEDLDGDWDFVSINSASASGQSLAHSQYTSPQRSRASRARATSQTEAQAQTRSTDQRADLDDRNDQQILNYPTDIQWIDPETSSLANEIDLKAIEVLEHLSGHLISDGWGDELDQHRLSGTTTPTPTSVTVATPVPSTASPDAYTYIPQSEGAGPSPSPAAGPRSDSGSIRSWREQRKKARALPLLRPLSEQPTYRSAPRPPPIEPIPATPQSSLPFNLHTSGGPDGSASPLTPRRESRTLDNNMPGLFLTRPSADGGPRTIFEGRHKGFFGGDRDKDKEGGKTKNGMRPPLVLATGASHMMTTNDEQTREKKYGPNSPISPIPFHLRPLPPLPSANDSAIPTRHNSTGGTMSTPTLQNRFHARLLRPKRPSTAPSATPTMVPTPPPTATTQPFGYTSPPLKLVARDEPHPALRRREDLAEARKNGMSAISFLARDDDLPRSSNYNGNNTNGPYHRLVSSSSHRHRSSISSLRKSFDWNARPPTNPSNPTHTHGNGSIVRPTDFTIGPAVTHILPPSELLKIGANRRRSSSSPDSEVVSGSNTTMGTNDTRSNVAVYGSEGDSEKAVPPHLERKGVGVGLNGRKDKTRKLSPGLGNRSASMGSLYVENRHQDAGRGRGRRLQPHARHNGSEASERIIGPTPLSPPPRPRTRPRPQPQFKPTSPRFEGYSLRSPPPSPSGITLPTLDRPSTLGNWSPTRSDTPSPIPIPPVAASKPTKSFSTIATTGANSDQDVDSSPGYVRMGVGEHEVEDEDMRTPNLDHSPVPDKDFGGGRLRLGRLSQEAEAHEVSRKQSVDSPACSTPMSNVSEAGSSNWSLDAMPGAAIRVRHEREEGEDREEEGTTLRVNGDIAFTRAQFEARKQPKSGVETDVLVPRKVDRRSHETQSQHSPRSPMSPTTPTFGRRDGARSPKSRRAGGDAEDVERRRAALREWLSAKPRRSTEPRVVQPGEGERDKEMEALKGLGLGLGIGLNRGQ